MRRAIVRARHALGRASLAAALCGSMLIACSDATDPNAGRAITELKGPIAAVSVGQGFATKTIISIKRSSSFTGAVTLTAVGLPPGLLVSFAPATLDGVSELSEMSISALSTIAPGTHSFTVRASGDGVDAKTLNVQVNVTLPAITLAAQTTTANVAQGSTQAIPLTITREGGFTGIVGLSVLGLPAGVTATFTPPAIQGDATTSTLTLAAQLTVQPLAKTVTLRASAQGLADKTIPIELTVGPATDHAVLVSASPLTMTVTGRQTVETTVTVERFAGFNGAVTITADGLPPQLEASADPIVPNSNTTTLRISGKPEAFLFPFLAGATHTLSVRANGPGITQASTNIAVTTTTMPQFNLFLDFVEGQPPQTSKVVTISRGSNASIRVFISRFQYGHPIALTISGMPANVTTNLPVTIPANVASEEFPVTVSVGADAVPGVYNLVIRGESATPPILQATIVLTVN